MGTAVRIASRAIPAPVVQLLRFRNWGVLRDVAALGSGTLLSQATILLATPVLLRLYPPADLGLYALLYSLSALLSTLCTWKIERLIVVVPSRQASLHLLTALVAIAVVVMFALLLFVAVVITLTVLPFEGTLLWSIPFSVFVLAVSAGQRATLIRERAYRVAAAAQLARTVVFLGGAIATALWWRGSILTGALPMLLWQIAGDLVGLLLQSWANGSVIRLKLKRPRLRRALLTVRNQGRFLGALGASQVICSINQQIPISAVAFAFGRAQAGLYTLAIGLVAVPCSVVATAVADVVNQRLARLYAERRPFSHLLAKTMGIMALIGIGPFLAIALLSPVVLPVLMGSRWVNAGPAITILSVASYLFFVEASAGHVAVIVRAQRYILVWQALRFGSLSFSAALAALKVVSFTGFLIVLVAGDCSLYLLEMIMVYRFVRRAEAAWR
jgi:O-antigen/teichoic acid export membrane protein